MRPLTLTATMALAAILGTKTETRRPLNPQPHAGVRKSVFVPSGVEDGHGREIRPPFGAAGEELWLREPGCVVDAGYKSWPWAKIKYLADGTISQAIPVPQRLLTDCGLPRWAFKFQGVPNGIFREAARHFFVVTAARVERLHEITRDGVRAEGITMPPSPRFFAQGDFSELHQEYACLWDRIYGKRPGLSWADNPWVSVTGFKRMEEARALPLLGGGEK